MPRPKGSKNVRPSMNGRLDARVPKDLELWIEKDVEGTSTSAKVIGLLRAARAMNLKPYYGPEAQ